MKEQIYDCMENVIGWNLYDFDSVAQMNKNILERNFVKIDESLDNKELPKYTLEQMEILKDAIGFAIDFMDAVAIIDNSEKLKENK